MPDTASAPEQAAEPGQPPRPCRSRRANLGLGSRTRLFSSRRPRLVRIDAGEQEQVDDGDAGGRERDRQIRIRFGPKLAQLTQDPKRAVDRSLPCCPVARLRGEVAEGFRQRPYARGEQPPVFLGSTERSAGDPGACLPDARELSEVVAELAQAADRALG